MHHRSFFLNRDHIDIWQIPLQGDPSSQRHLLKPDELQRADRFYFDRHRRRFTHARAALRRILALYLDQAADKIEFDYNTHGKPEVRNKPQAIEFNLSHSKDWGLLAIRQFQPVGIDIECFSQRELIKLAQHSFSAQEVKQWLQLPEKNRESAFFHIWSQKEAFIKAKGMGLAYPLSSFAVTVQSPAGFNHLAADEPEWQSYSYQPIENAWAAICSLPPFGDLRYFNYAEQY